MPKFSDKLKNAEIALSFEDVLLLPGPSDVRPEEMDVSARIPPDLELKIPILSSPMDTVTGKRVVEVLGSLGGLGILPRNLPESEVFSILKSAREEGIPVGVAVGPSDTELAKKLAEEGASAVVIDSAHGHSRAVVNATAQLSSLDVPLISGNVVTAEAAKALAEAGATGIRVGVGPGHACTTREVAGVGCPQLTAIAQVADALEGKGVLVIADGGIEKPSDMIKALAAGAGAVMLGYLIAQSYESPGERIEVNGKCYKRYRGMGSRGALSSGSQRYGEFKKVPEGEEGFVECRGPLSEIIEYLIGGLKQGMGYVGARSIEDLQEKARFVRITPFASREGGPRGMLRDGSWGESR
jgi:IMP dehydrogenase